MIGKDVITDKVPRNLQSSKKKKENVAPNSLVFARHRSTLCALLFVTRLQSFLFSSVVVAFYEQNMCRSLSDYIQNKPLLRSMETRRFSPRKKKEEIYI